MLFATKESSYDCFCVFINLWKEVTSCDLSWKQPSLSLLGGSPVKAADYKVLTGVYMSLCQKDLSEDQSEREI